jgi:hypothetical protein
LVDPLAFGFRLLHEFRGCGAQVADNDADVRPRERLGDSRGRLAAAKSKEQESDSVVRNTGFRSEP